MALDLVLYIALFVAIFILLILIFRRIHMKLIMFYLILGLLADKEGIKNAIYELQSDPDRKAELQTAFQEILADPEIRQALIELLIL